RNSCQDSFLSECEQAIQRCPAHESRMCTVRTTRPRFPDTFVGTIPILRHILSKTDQRFLGGPIEALPILSILRSRLNDFSINVKLQLLPRTISDAHRARTEIPVQIFQFSFRRSDLSKNGVQNPQFWLCEPCCVQEPCKETFCFVKIA